MLATSEDLIMIGEAADGASAIQLIGESPPNVVLLDLRMPGMSGMEVLEHIRKTWPEIAVLILTTYDEDELMMHALQLGACGYLLKETPLDTLFHAIRTAARGEIVVQPEIMARILAHTTYASQPTRTTPPQGYMELTRRELEVLAGVARGERSKEIARRLGITERTVRAYLTNIYTKLNVESRSEAIAVALKQGILPLSAQ
jgi:NarL family two-component system response regulator YdfI